MYICTSRELCLGVNNNMCAKIPMKTRIFLTPKADLVRSEYV